MFLERCLGSALWAVTGGSSQADHEGYFGVSNTLTGELTSSVFIRKRAHGHRSGARSDSLGAKARFGLGDAQWITIVREGLCDHS